MSNRVSREYIILNQSWTFPMSLKDEYNRLFFILNIKYHNSRLSLILTIYSDSTNDSVELCTKNISFFFLSCSTICCSLLDIGLSLICVVWVSEEARWSYSQQWGRFPCRRAWLLYEWRTILCYPLLQPPPFSLPWVFHQHPPFSPAGVVAGGWSSGGSRMGAKSKANDLQSTWRSICSAPVLGRLWMWCSQLCWECEPPLCQGWTGEAHNSI